MKRGFVLALVALVIGGVGGLALAGVGATLVHRTSTNAFCTGCHEMTWAQASYHDTIHFSNPSGVQVQCRDCHLQSHPWPTYLWQKAKFGTRDLWAHLWGTIDEKAEYDARKLEMARTVWTWLETTDSATCKGCHTADAMVAADQPVAASAAHDAALKAGQTCIACHKGVGHGITPGGDNGGDDAGQDDAAS